MPENADVYTALYHVFVSIHLYPLTPMPQNSLRANVSITYIHQLNRFKSLHSQAERQ